MSMRYPGGLIASSPVNAAYPSGVWTQAQTQPYAAQNVWMRDQYWPNTTLLLQGNGTNGAQNNTFLDSSTNNFTITRNGNTTQGSFTPYEANGYWSNYFDGSASTPMYFADNNGFTFDADFTVEAWVYLSNTSAFQVVTGKWDVGGQEWLLGVDSGGVAEFHWAPYSVGGPAIESSPGAVSTNQWVHLAAVRSGSTITLYVNGTSVGTRTNGTAGTNQSTLVTVGYLQYLGGDKLTGYISNLRIVKGSAVYAAAFTPSTSPLTAITNTQLLTCQSNRFRDTSTNNFTPTVNGVSVQAFQPFPGATTWSGSVLGGSGYFDGSGDYLGLQDSNSAYDLGAGTPFTVECWFYSTQSLSATTSYNLIQRGGGTDSWSTSSGIQFALYTYGGQIEWDFNTSGSPTTVVSTAGVVANTWYHVAVSYNGTTTALFLNGSRQATTTASYTFPTTRNIARIGTKSAGTTPAWQGYISDMRVVNGTAIYDPTQTTLTVPTAPLTAVTNTKLLCNFTNAGIFDSAMMNDLETVGNAQVSTSVVKYGTGSMAFDGNGDYLYAANTPQLNLGTGDFACECWVYITSWSNTDPHLFAKWNNGGSGYAYKGRILSSGASLRFGTGNNGTLSTEYDFSGANISLNTWTHIAFTRSGSSLRAFVNGVQIGSTATTSNNLSSNSAFLVGASSDGGFDYIYGYIDDLRITKGAARYISNFTPPIARMPQQ